ncbi:MAG: hypothetical protein JWQ27_1546 [Ferruginibacter sp.]|nr:hypothetical protein [Ferruginibacter sp.]
MDNRLQLINQLFEIQGKIAEIGHSSSFERNFNRLFNIFEEEGFIIQDPINESYADSRADCEASIVGASSSKMKITKTLKPAIYQKQNGQIQLVQKAVVLVEKI